MTRLHVVVFATLLGVSSALPAAGQSTASAPPQAANLGIGWAALAAGDTSRAATVALAALAQHPGDVSAGALLIEAQTMRSGASAGLTAYEQWLGSRAAEDPYLIRIVALATLREAARSASTGDAQQKALRALAEAGDEATLADLARTAQSGDLLAVEALAAAGNESAVRSLVTSLRNVPGDRSRIIGALAATRSPLAVQPLIEVLSDPLPTNRIAAADALGELGASQAIPRLHALLNENPFAVRFAVARALFRLHEADGTALLRQLENSEYPMIRAQALEATSSEPDQAWLDAVRRLLTEPDPQARLLAARLIAPHDPDAARAAIQRLASDDNVAIREAATTASAEVIPSDYAGLRQFLRNPDALVRVNAALRILALTR